AGYEAAALARVLDPEAARAQRLGDAVRYRGLSASVASFEDNEHARHRIGSTKTAVPGRPAAPRERRCRTREGATRKPRVRPGSNPGPTCPCGTSRSQVSARGRAERASARP